MTPPPATSSGRREARIRTAARSSGSGSGRGRPTRHVRGAIHSDYDKAGWRVTRGGVPFMLPTLAELEKLIGELGKAGVKVVVCGQALAHNKFPHDWVNRDVEVTLSAISDVIILEQQGYVLFPL